MIRRSFLLPQSLAATLNKLAKDSGTSPDLLVSAALHDFMDGPVEIDGRVYKPSVDKAEEA